MPNTPDNFPTREDFVAIVSSIRAALGREAEVHRGRILEWACAEGWCPDEAYLNKVFESVDYSATGPEYVLRPARKAGWRGSAKVDFAGLEVDEAEAIITEAQAESAERVATTVQHAREQMNERYAVAVVGNKTVVLRFDDHPDSPRVMSKISFFDLERPNTVRLPSGKVVPLAPLWFEWAQRRTFSGGMAMHPLAPDVTGPQPSSTVLNTWRGLATVPAPSDGSDWPIIKNYLLEVVCAGNERDFDFVLDWIAQAVQRPYVKPGTALILKGRQGAGKTTLAELLRGIFDSRHVVSVERGESLIGRFNGHLAEALFVCSDEAAFVGNPEVQNRLKALVTDRTMTVERKGLDQYSVPSFHRLVMTTNEDHVVKADPDARRWFVLEVSDKRIRDHAYFQALHDALKPNSAEMRAFVRDLIGREVNDADLRRAPITRALVDQMIHSLSAPQRWLYERLCECLPSSRETTPNSPAARLSVTEFEGGLEWPQHVLKEALSDDFRAWAQGKRYLRGLNDNGGLKRTLDVVGHESQPNVGGRRARVYTLRSLDEARRMFGEEFLRGANDERVWGKNAEDDQDNVA